MKTSPLHSLHEAHGAVFLEQGGWRLPAHFGDSAGEYDTVRSGAGWFDLADRAVLSVTGADSVEWLQGMVSNDVAALGEGEGIPAAVLNIQGKILADVRVLRTGDAFLLDLDEPLVAGVLEHLNRYLIADEVEIRDLSGELAMVSLQGPEAGTVLSGLLDGGALPEKELGHGEVEWAGSRVRVVRTARAGFDLAAPRDRLPDAVGSPAAREVPWVGLHARETLRIEAGVPRYGLDMDADTLLLETCLDHAVSFTKGCYLGQETVERIHSRGHVNRRLVGLKVNGGTVPAPQDSVLDQDRDIGRVTSAAASPRLGCPVALGYVHRDHTAPGTPVTIARGDTRVPAVVAALPFAG